MQYRSKCNIFNSELLLRQTKHNRSLYKGHNIVLPHYYIYNISTHSRLLIWSILTFFISVTIWRFRNKMMYIGNGVYLEWCIMGMVYFWNGVYWEWCILGKMYIEIGVYWKLCVMEMVYIWNGVYWEWCIFGMVYIENGVYLEWCILGLVYIENGVY